MMGFELEEIHNEHSVCNMKGSSNDGKSIISSSSFDDLPAVPDDHSFAHSPWPRAQLLHLLDDSKAHPHVGQLAKYNMLS